MQVLQLSHTDLLHWFNIGHCRFTEQLSSMSHMLILIQILRAMNLHPDQRGHYNENKDGESCSCNDIDNDGGFNRSKPAELGNGKEAMKQFNLLKGLRTGFITSCDLVDWQASHSIC